MKKITLLLITILLPFSMMSQGWTEGFEDLTVDGFGSVVWPEGWVALNGPSDAGTQQWTASDDAASGAQAAYIQYEPLGAGAGASQRLPNLLHNSLQVLSKRVYLVLNIKKHTVLYIRQIIQ